MLNERDRQTQSAHSVGVSASTGTDADEAGTGRNAANPETTLADRYGAGVDPAGWRPIETVDKDAGRLLLGVVRRGRLEEVHIGFFSFAINEDEEDCWWSEQADDEIVPSVWMPFIDIPLPLPTPGGSDE